MFHQECETALAQLATRLRHQRPNELPFQDFRQVTVHPHSKPRIKSKRTKTNPTPNKLQDRTSLDKTTEPCLWEPTANPAAKSKNHVQNLPLTRMLRKPTKKQPRIRESAKREGTQRRIRRSKTSTKS
uniref:(northern house mosquito) hypothetical protein n=1 Tax=Culex pipiens TaxID=7175 RepID=A0A8D8CPT6_CULPI